MARRAALLACVLLGGGCDPCDVARVVDGAGAVVLEVCLVGVASTAEARAAGLRGRPPLAANEGLLLVFPLEGEVCIVNSGVNQAIDVVFISEGAQVVAVERGVPAEAPVPRCHATTRQVLEVQASQADRVNVGDHLESPSPG